MGSGGARARSGPAPDPTALRPGRGADPAGWVDLPAEGRKGRIPVWPLLGQAEREQVLWRKLWRSPQAVMWERYGQQMEVALYVRRLTEAELPAAHVTLGTLVRQMGDSLGLTTPGLRANRWRIVAAAKEKEAARTAVKARTAARTPARKRFQVVRDAADGDPAER